jgi:hypothetical protein
MNFPSTQAINGSINFHFLTMNERPRRMSFRVACAALGIQENDLDNANDDDEFDAEFAHSNDDEEFYGDDNEGNLTVYEESSEDGEEEEEENDPQEGNASDEEMQYEVFGIKYTEQPLPERRRRRNILTERGRPLCNPANEVESFQYFMNEEILRTILMYKYICPTHRHIIRTSKCSDCNDL